MSYKIFTQAAHGDTSKIYEGSQLIKNALTVKGAALIRNIQAQMYGGSVNESMKLVKTHVNGDKQAKVYKDSEWGEYRVKHYTGGKHHSDADYHTSDADDAHGTAQQWLKG